MAFSSEQVRKIAQLSRMALDEDEISKMKHDLEKIVSYVEVLNEVDVKNVEPMEHAVSADLFTRPDVAKPVLGRDGLANCAANEDGLIKVPKIIE